MNQLNAKEINVGLSDSNAGLATEPPYFKKRVTRTIRQYNPRYGNDRICECGHPYHRHFDSHENMEPIGCKYCDCRTFKEAANM